jgi:SAM-dependent methyltransferase
MSIRYEGFCPICARPAVFAANGDWLRDELICQSCENGSLPRERALALILNEVEPQWRTKRIHESSPAYRGISAKLKRECGDYIASQFFPNAPLGSEQDGFRNENLEQQTFADSVFDVVISLDVMEHVYNPDKAFHEIWRTLKIGGSYLCTFPISKWYVEGHTRRFDLNADGSRRDFRPPEFHGNPISEDGAIVTFDYGYEVHNSISSWAQFDVRIYRFDDRTHGILGDFTEVCLCKKRMGPTISSPD